MLRRNTICATAFLVAVLTGLVFWWIGSSPGYQPILLNPGESARDSAGKAKELIYRIPLSENHLLGISFDTGSSSVALSLRRPDGQSLREIPCSYYKDSHRITEITTTSSDYFIAIRGCNEEEPGSFELTISASSVSREDRQRVAVERLMMEADISISEYREQSRREAKRKYKEALQICIDIQDRTEQSRILTKLGVVSLDMGQISDAYDFLNRALAISEMEQSPLQAKILIKLAELFLREGDAETAKSYALEALDLRRNFSNTAAKAEGLLVLGLILYEVSDYTGAIHNFDKSLTLWRQLENPRGIARALLNLASSHTDLTKLTLASDELNEALRLFRKIGDRQGQTHTLVALAHFHALTEDKQKALDFYNHAQELLEESGDLLALGQLYSGKGFIYEELGDYSNTLEYWKLSIEKYKASEHRIAEFNMLASIGEVYYQLGDYQNALGMLEESLIFTRKIPNQRLEAYLLYDMATIYEATGEISTAMEILEEALELNKQVVDRRQESYTRMSLGHLCESQGEFLQALDFYRQAIKLNRDTQDRFGEIGNLYRIGHCYLRLNKLDEALDTVRQSVEIIEKLRAGVNSYGIRTSYFGSIHQHYDLYIDTLMRLHQGEADSVKDAEALAISERSRARTLLENIATVSLQSMEDTNPELMEKAKILNAQLDAKIEEYTQLLSEDADADSIELLRNEIDHLYAENEEVQGQIRRIHPEYEALVKPETLNLPRIQQELDEDSLLLEYSLGEENSYLWAVSHNNFKSEMLPPESEITRKVQRLRELMTARSELTGEENYSMLVEAADNEFQLLAAELSLKLLGPVRDLLGKKRLVIVADGVLQYLPFSALPTPQTADLQPFTQLVLEHEIVNLPSVSTLSALRRESPKREKPDRTLAVFADPVYEKDDDRVNRSIAKPTASAEVVQGILSTHPMSVARENESDLNTRQIEYGWDLSRLPSTRMEAEAILKLVPRKKQRLEKTGINATRSAVMSEDLKRYRIVHLATHARIDDRSPELSNMVLSLFDKQGNPQNGYLSLRDIYSLNLSAELVVLSACETALGKEVKGEGLISMVRGFIYSGTPRVLASLWKVDDRATAELMEEFYSQMLQHKQSPAAALREAQMAQLKKKSRQAPYYWAGFQLQGDWK